MAAVADKARRQNREQAHTAISQDQNDDVIYKCATTTCGNIFTQPSMQPICCSLCNGRSAFKTQPISKVTKLPMIQYFSMR
jgi:DNA-directed RNA polymerase subunit RPC12/RpoP